MLGRITERACDITVLGEGLQANEAMYYTRRMCVNPVKVTLSYQRNIQGIWTANSSGLMGSFLLEGSIEQNPTCMSQTW